MPCYRICQLHQTQQPSCNPPNDYNNMVDLRKWWEAWDLRILILYILISQLYLHFFGRLRRRNKSRLTMIVNVWFLYLFSDLLATIALGKLSKLKIGKEDADFALRVMWAPLILFYLGGPDTITVLRVEENRLWVRHLIGLCTLGARAAYALIVTWNPKDRELSLLALFAFIPGIIKYGERVWVVKSRSKDEGFVLLYSPTNGKICATPPKAKLILLAYSWLQTLRPHSKDYKCDRSEVEILVTNFRESVSTSTADAFKLIEIELGLIYDMLFSKVGMIFTQLGSILRFLSFSFIVSALVIYVVRNKPHGYSEGDHIVTIILLAGAIILETAGIMVQLRSDWAMIWACKNRSEWATPVLVVHEFLISKWPSQRWSGVMGQFSSRELNKKPTVRNKTGGFLSCREKMLKRFSLQECLGLHQSLGLQECLGLQESLGLQNCIGSQECLGLQKSLSLQKSPVQHVKDLIMDHLRKEYKAGDVDNLPTSTQEIADQEIADVNNLQTSTQKTADVDTSRTSTQDITDVDTSRTSTQDITDVDNSQEFKWSIDPEFGQCIVIWHIATEVCYEQHTPKDDKDMVKPEAVKILSDYMMHLLVACPPTFPFCKKKEKILQDYADTKERFVGGKSEEAQNEGNTTVKEMVRNEKRWDIMGSMWVKMLCYAARKYPVENHIEELRHGGEFLTHIWLLQMHFGEPKRLEGSNSSLKDELDSGAINIVSTANDISG